MFKNIRHASAGSGILCHPGTVHAAPEAWDRLPTSHSTRRGAPATARPSRGKIRAMRNEQSNAVYHVLTVVRPLPQPKDHEKRVHQIKHSTCQDNLTLEPPNERVDMQSLSRPAWVLSGRCGPILRHESRINHMRRNGEHTYRLDF